MNCQRTQLYTQLEKEGKKDSAMKDKIIKDIIHHVSLPQPASDDIKNISWLPSSAAADNPDKLLYHISCIYSVLSDSTDVTSGWGGWPCNMNI